MSASRVDYPKSKLLLLLLINYFGLLHLTLVFLALILPNAFFSLRLCYALLTLYLLPPICARVIISIWGLPSGSILQFSPQYFVWWSLFQVQIVFMRLPFLEEVLRLVPGLYSMWLRLWGARIGKLTFWSPGVMITDRSYLQVGDHVIFGAGVRINPHVLVEEKGDSSAKLLIDIVSVESNVVVGGYSLLTSGAVLKQGQVTKAMQLLPPFSILEDGKRIKRMGQP